MCYCSPLMSKTHCAEEDNSRRIKSNAMCNVCNAIYCGEDTSSIVCVALLQITLRNVLKSIEGMHK